jgi:hypothetical protein
MANASKLIDERIAELGDWRGELMARLRAIINQADPNLSEEWKWGTAVWTSRGNVVGMGAFKEGVKLNFFGGASLPDPQNSSTPASMRKHLERSTSRRAVGSMRRPCATSCARRQP